MKQNGAIVQRCEQRVCVVKSEEGVKVGIADGCGRCKGISREHCSNCVCHFGQKKGQCLCLNEVNPSAHAAPSPTPTKGNVKRQCSPTPTNSNVLPQVGTRREKEMLAQ